MTPLMSKGKALFKLKMVTFGREQLVSGIGARFAKNGRQDATKSFANIEISMVKKILCGMDLIMVQAP